jgi:hypothetical protein
MATLRLTKSDALVHVLENTDLDYRVEAETILVETDVPDATLATLRDVMGDELLCACGSYAEGECELCAKEKAMLAERNAYEGYSDQDSAHASDCAHWRGEACDCIMGEQS